MKMPRVCVIGGGGHAKVVISLLRDVGYEIAAVLDDDPTKWGQSLLGYTISGPMARLSGLEQLPAVVAIGDNATRQAIAEQYGFLDWLTIVHPTAHVDTSAELAPGTQVMAGAIVQAGAHIGRHAIINTGSVVEHDCCVGDFAHVAPGSRLAGGVRIGTGVLFGVGASSIPGVSVGDWTQIGAGAAVVGDISAGGIAKGVPARFTAKDELQRLISKPPALITPSVNSGHSGDVDDEVHEFRSQFDSGAAAESNGRELPLRHEQPGDLQQNASDSKGETTHDVIRTNQPGDAKAERRIYLSPPTVTRRERELLLEAFDSGWVAPVGPHVDAFEKEFAAQLGVPYAVALASGSAALHLALQVLGVGPGDRVATSTFTFVASANAIRYVGAEPVFIDSDRASWNLNSELLGEELESSMSAGRPIKAVLAVDVIGQCADYERIGELCRFYEVPLIEDAAESLGATFDGKPAGTFGDVGCFSFNGNKIVTTSGGGMLITRRKDLADAARKLATHARDPAAHYEHSELGYNYRMSNLLAAVGRGQLATLAARVQKRRANFATYQAELGDLPGIEFMPELPGGRCTRWLTCLIIDPDEFGATREDVRLALEAENIEARPLWKPMHCQPLYADCRIRGGEVSEHLFERGLCLPSGHDLTTRDIDRIVAIIRAVRPRQIVAERIDRAANPSRA